MDSSYLNGLSDVFNDYSDIYNKNSSAGNIKNKLESTDYSKSTDDELMDACKEFEAYFVEQAFKAMQKWCQKTRKVHRLIIWNILGIH